MPIRINHLRQQIKNKNKMHAKKYRDSSKKKFNSVALKENPQPRIAYFITKNNSGTGTPYESFPFNRQKITTAFQSPPAHASKYNKKTKTQASGQSQQPKRNHKKQCFYDRSDCRIEDFLGIETSPSGFRKSGQEDAVQFSDKELIKQNLELLSINQRLLYEKQYYRHKATIQQVYNRDIKRDLKNAHKQLLTLYKKLPKSPPQQRCKENRKAYTEAAENRGGANSKIFPITDKSSLLISESEPEKNTILIEKDSNKIPVISTEEPDRKSPRNSWIEQTENQFSQLLQIVQKENNQKRKMTLRKMLANKALELKNIKKM